MLLVIGGIASGKRSFVRSRGFEDTQMSDRLSSAAPVLLGLEELLRDGPIEGHAWDALMTKQVIVCCEVGLGVIPLGADERAWRERVGRVCARLATVSDEVVRMVCGIPVKLK